MKRELTDLEIFLFERVKVLENALTERETDLDAMHSELNGMQIKINGLSSMARIGREQIIKTVNDPVFQEKIKSLEIE